MLGLALLAAATLSIAASDDQSGDWADEHDAVNARIAAVNEGGLELLDGAAGRRVHRHRGQITIAPRSLGDGWVEMTQCHNDLDRVAEAQILFHPQRARALRVTRFNNIDAAFVEANTIQLRGIRPDSEICLYAESRALHKIDEGVYELRNGPFMRRFLDGYYPLRLQLEIRFPHQLVLADHSPAQAPGFSVRSGDGQIAVDALFEGQLRTVFRFLQRS